ncbi:hypothetical protein CAJAP_08966 [Camponotus japonicus]
MIKLFFITLLCVTLVFAESLLHSRDALDKPMTGLHNADNFMNGGAKLVRRSAQGGPEGRPGGGAGMGGGFGFGANAGGGFGKYLL